MCRFVNSQVSDRASRPSKLLTFQGIAIPKFTKHQGASDSRPAFRTMMAFTPAQPLSRSHNFNYSTRTSRTSRNQSLHRPTATRVRTPTCQAADSPKFTRRAALSLLVASTVLPLIEDVQAEPLKVETYDANKSRRYIPEGRPPPDRPAPNFDSSKSLFDIDDQLRAQDLKIGNGEVIANGTLVIARWLAVLDDGTTVDDSNEKQAALFRPGAHQVPPGIEDALIGMQTGGVRRVSGSASRILSNIAVGNNIGERSLVPSDGTMYVDIFVDGVNPYGKSR